MTVAPPDHASLAALSKSLPPIDKAVRPAGSLKEFCRYYQIDFGERLRGVQHRVGSVQSGDYSLAVHCWTQASATQNLLVVHGYTDHVGLFGHLVEYGLSHGCNVVAFDLPGHGLSSGAKVSIGEFAEYSQAIKDVLEAAPVDALPWWAMAQSTGCAALIDYARHYPWPFTATVFLAPLIRPAGWLKIKLGHVLLHRFKGSVRRTFANNSSDKAFLAFIRRDPLQSSTLSISWIGALRRWLSGLSFKSLGVGPLLVIQGDSDGTVAWRYNMRKIAMLFPGGQIAYIAGAGHQLANESASIRAGYLAKVTRFLDTVAATTD